MDGLKQRVIGALVLVSLAVIFVPMLFDEPHTERSSRLIDIPEEPPFPEVQQPPEPDAEPPSYRLEEPVDTGTRARPQDEPQPEPSAPVEPEQQQPVPDQPSAAQQTQVEPRSEAKPEPEPEPEQAPKQEAKTQTSAEFARSLEGAWLVQLASFGDAANARRLRDKVREQGYDSHVQKVEQGDTTFTRVFSGPFAEKADAEKAKKALDSSFGVNSLVTSGGK